jgi:hypothetical protein
MPAWSFYPLWASGGKTAFNREFNPDHPIDLILDLPSV